VSLYTIGNKYWWFDWFSIISVAPLFRQNFGLQKQVFVRQKQKNNLLKFLTLHAVVVDHQKRICILIYLFMITEQPAQLISSGKKKERKNYSRDVEDCGGAPRRKSTLKPANFSYITIWQHWLGNTISPKKLSD